MMNTRYGIILIIMSTFIEMLTCNAGLYSCYHVIQGYFVYIYLFSIPGFLYIYKSLSFFFFNLSDRFQNKVLPRARRLCGW